MNKFLLKSIVLMLTGSLFASTAFSPDVIAKSAQSSEQTKVTTDGNPVKRKEIIDNRTEYSKTYANSDGTLTTEIFSIPIHYMDEATNKLKPIVNDLEESSSKIYNKAHAFDVEFEKKHTNDESLLEIKEEKYKIGLNPVDIDTEVKSAPSKDTSIVKDNAVTYPEVFEDADLKYTLGNDRIKEEIVLKQRPKSSENPVIYTFSLDLGNLTYENQENGSILLVDKSTREAQYYIEAPMMYDSFKPEGYKENPGVNTVPEEALSYDIKYVLRTENNQLYIDLIPDEDWLLDENRVYPVTLDPSIVKFQPTYALTDTNIRSQFPKQTAPTETTLGVGLYKNSTQNNVIRSLIKFDTSAIPQGAKVITADLNLWLASVSNDTDIDVTLHQVNTPWTEYSASWMYADATKLWAKQGGDYNTSQVATANVGPLTSLIANYKWSLTPDMVEKWIHDPSINKGFLLKSSSETTNSYKKFISGDDTANASYTPLLSITYTSSSRLGLEDYWAYDSHSIANGTSYTNLGTGNNVIQFTDYSLTGRGNVSLNFARTYNSKSSEGSPFGYGWSYTGSETIIDSYKTGRVIFTDSDGTSHEFQYDAATGKYSSPPGKYLTLKKLENPNGAVSGYELTDKYGYVTHFDAVSYDDQLSIHRARISYEQDLHGNKITYKHDSGGNLTEITDPSGRSIIFTYDTDGMVDYATLDGRKTDYSYTNGKLITFDQYNDDGKYSRTQFSYGDNYIKTILDPNYRLTTYTYDQEFLVKVQEPTSSASDTDPEDRPATTYHYDISRHTADVTDPNGNTTNYILNSDYVVKSLKDAIGATIQYELDPNYNVTRLTNPDGTYVQRTYDKLGNVLTETDEIQHVKTYEYNDWSRVTKETDQENRVTSYTYTPEGALETTTDPKQQVTSYLYDAYGNLETVTNPDKSIETYSYDEKGNYVQSVKDAAGNTTVTKTDAVGNVISETDGNGNPTAYEYDKLNRLRQVKDAASHITKYDYDSAGNLKEKTNAKQFKTKYVYNGLGQLVTRTNALGHTWSMEYDANGNLVKTTTPNGKTITSTYTSINQLESVSVDGQSLRSYLYNDNGELFNVDNGQRSFTYKDNGLLDTETDRGNSKSYQYYSNDLLKDFEYAAGAQKTQLNYKYTTLDELQSILRDGQRFITYHYNSVGDLTQADYGNGLVTKAHYNDGNELQTYGNYTAAGTPIREYVYTYDGNGNIKTIETDHGTTSYNYDQRNQLEQETLPDGKSIQYSYDSVGNRTGKLVTSNGQQNTTTYDFNDLNQLVRVGNQDYQYDHNGNLIHDGQKTYQYNALDQLIEIREASGTLVMKASYDEQGRRNQVVTPSGTTNYFYENNQVIYETDGNNQITKEYVWDNNNKPVAMIKDGKTYYYHLNGHGDVVSLTDATGQEVASYDYDAWGNILEQSGPLAEENPYRYTGYRYDASTDLYYLMARYYNPDLGVFLSLDPLEGLDLTMPLNDNGYSYALNNPMAFMDEDGEKPVAKLIGSALNWLWKSAKNIFSKPKKGKNGSFGPNTVGAGEKYIPKSIKMVKDKYLKQKGIDAHKIKGDFIGKKNIAYYDIFVDKDTGMLWIYRKGGKGEGIPTYEYIK